MRQWLALGLAFGFGLVADSASAQIKLGVGGPITGGSGAGAQLKNGVEQAEDINAAGGILGQKIQVWSATIAPIEGRRIGCQQIRRRRVKFVSAISIPAIPSSEVLQENGILEITPAATNPKVTERGMWNIFRVGRDDQQGVVAGAIIADKFKGKRVAVVHDKTTAARGLPRRRARR